MLQKFHQIKVNTQGQDLYNFTSKVNSWIKNEKLNQLTLLELNEKTDLLHYAGKAAALNCEQQGCNPPWENELLKYMKKHL